MVQKILNNQSLFLVTKLRLIFNSLNSHKLISLLFFKLKLKNMKYVFKEIQVLLILLCILLCNFHSKADVNADTVFVITNTMIKNDNEGYSITSRFPFITINDTLYFTSTNVSNKINFVEDTVVLVSDSTLIYQGEIINFTNTLFSIGSSVILPAEGIYKTYKKILQTRENTMNFFRMQQKLSEPSTISLFDQTNVRQGVQKKPYILNANIQIPIALGGYRWNVKGVLATVHLIPQFKVRIFQDDTSVGDISRPVRTPSYMPGGILFLTHEKIWNEQRKNNHYVGFKVFHHSNGQDGPEFVDNEVNVYNGNFGEQAVFEFIYGGVHKTKPTPKKVDIDDYSKQFKMYSETSYNHLISWRVSYEYHPYNLSTEYFRDLNLYGRNRINASLDLMKISKYNTYIFIPEIGHYKKIRSNDEKEKWRLSIHLNYIIDQEYSTGNNIVQKEVEFLDKSRINFYLSAFMPLRGSPYTALFCEAGYYGSDPYNIYFQYRMLYARFGVSLNFFDR